MNDIKRSTSFSSRQNKRKCVCLIENHDKHWVLTPYYKDKLEIPKMANNRIINDYAKLREKEQQK